MMKIIISENSFIARIAAMVLHEKCMAVTIGRTIYLWNAGKEELLKNRRWLQHELAHVQQYEQKGCLKFLALYLWESLKRGYQENKFEVEARAKEDEDISFGSFKIS